MELRASARQTDVHAGGWCSWASLPVRKVRKRNQEASSFALLRWLLGHGDQILLILSPATYTHTANPPHCCHLNLQVPIQTFNLQDTAEHPALGSRCRSTDATGLMAAPV